MNLEYCLFKTEKKRVVWEVTHRCNYACLHCCSKSGTSKEKELSYDNMISVLNQLQSAGVQEIYYSGGEPFIREDMMKILEETRKRNILANVSTNGSFIKEDTANELKRIDVNLIHISLDSHDKKLYNEFRGGAYFEKTINAIKCAKKAGLYVRVGAVIWKNNVENLGDLIGVLKKLGVDEVVFNWLVKVGRLKDNENQSISLERFDAVVSQIKEYMEKNKDIIKISMHRSNYYKDDNSCCVAGDKIVFILPDGRISPCSWLAKLDSRLITKDTLVEKTLIELFESNEFKLWKEILEERCKKAHSGCPAICYERNGSYNTEDPLLIGCSNDL